MKVAAADAAGGGNASFDTPFRPTLVNLPSEILIHILTCLPLLDLISCSRTNRLFHSLFTSSTLVQYVAELRSYAFEDIPFGPLSLGERLKKLRSRENAWEDLDFSAVITLPVTFFCSNIYDLSGGFFLLGESPYERDLLDNGETCALRYLRLPSVGDESPNVSWSRIDIKASIIDVALAIEEYGLVIIAAYPQHHEQGIAVDVHFIDQMTHEYHPLAQKPVLHIPLITPRPFNAFPEDTPCSIRSEVVGDILVILVTFPRGEETLPGNVFIYDWKAGKQLYFRCSHDICHTGFAFLATDVILLASTVPVIELCHLKLDTPPPEYPQPLETGRILSLPALAQGVNVSQILCHCDPKPRGRANSMSKKPFGYDPVDAIVIVTFFVDFDINADERIEFPPIVMIVHRAAMLSYLTPGEPDPPEPVRANTPVSAQAAIPNLDVVEVFYNEPLIPRPAEAHMETASSDSANSLKPSEDSSSTSDDVSDPGRWTVPWVDWEPLTRWFAGTQNDTWSTTTSGQRHAVLKAGTLAVLNFNRHAVLRFRHECAASGRRSLLTRSALARKRGCIEPVQLIFKKIFMEPIICRLPYVETSLLQPFVYDHAIIDEDRIVAINVDEAENVKEVVIHVVGERSCT